jgi:hypothetical protein
MPNSKRSSYKGYCITTRWVELGPLAERKPQRFNASYTVNPSGAAQVSWQQFPKAVFDTGRGASDNALSAAKKAIDLDLAMA